MAVDSQVSLPNFWDRESAYRRRLLVILPFVLAAFTAAFFASGRPGYERITRFVGWRGPMELLPDITIEPEIATAEIEPAPAGASTSVPQNVAVAAPREEGPGLDMTIPDPEPAQQSSRGTTGAGATESHARPGENSVSYSSEYVILRMVKPHYPEHERAEGVEGNVTVELLIGVDGKVAECNVLNVVGPSSFEQATLEAVRHFLFQAPVIDGKPSEMWIKFVVKFRINS